jgi:hypothetical protein
LLALCLYPVLAAERVRTAAAVAAALAVAALAVGVAARRPLVLALALAGFGVEYGLFLGVERSELEPVAPLVAAGLFVVAELAYGALEPPVARIERPVLVRTLAWRTTVLALATVVGAGVLAATGGVAAGVAIEAVGAAAAVAAVGLVVVATARR